MHFWRVQSLFWVCGGNNDSNHMTNYIWLREANNNVMVKYFSDNSYGLGKFITGVHNMFNSRVSSIVTSKKHFPASAISIPSIIHCD